MLPRALLFTSNEQSAFLLKQALSQLGMQTDLCREIFAAVEKLTGSSYPMIVADWQQELEASFLLKTARDLKSTQSTFVLAIVEQREVAAVLQAGADGVLIRPLAIDQIRNTLLTARQRIPVSQAPSDRPALEDLALPRAVHTAEITAEKLSDLRQPIPQSVPPTFEPEGESEAAAAAAPSFAGYARHRGPVRHWNPRFIMFVVFLGLAGGSSLGMWRLGYFSRKRPDPNRTGSFLRPGLSTKPTGLSAEPSPRANPDPKPAPNLAAETAAEELWDKVPTPRAAQVRVKPVITSTRVSKTATSTNAPLAEPSSSYPWNQITPKPRASNPQIPQSLSVSVEAMSAQTNNTKSPETEWSSDSVTLPESVSRTLLVQQSLPAYPEQALKAGLEGAVVLAARVGKDGTIQDVKLVQGPLFLGKAAIEAVQQWRYKPYRLNGEIVEIQTLITIDFRRP